VSRSALGKTCACISRRASESPSPGGARSSERMDAALTGGGVVVLAVAEGYRSVVNVPEAITLLRRFFSTW